MKDEIEVFDFVEFMESVGKTAEKFCGNGYRVLTSCPICLREVLTIEKTRLLAKAFASPQNTQKVEAFASTHDIGTRVLVPSKPETAQLLDYRLILAPVCNCHSQIELGEIEKQSLLISGFGKIIKV